MKPHGGIFATYTIYHGASDVPTEYCVVEWIIDVGVPMRHGRVWLVDTLEQAQSVVPPRADHCMPRSDTDDQTIVETWI